MSRRCPACGGTWPDGSRFCGACGALLDTQASPQPSDDPAAGPRGRRRSVAVAGSLVVLVVVAVAIALSDRSPIGGTEVGDDTVALPTTTATESDGPTGQPGPIRCMRAQVPVDCLVWDVDTGHRISLGPRLPGAGALVDRQDDRLSVRDPDTGEVVWEREDLAGRVPLMVVDDVLVLGGGNASSVQGVDLDDGERLWTAADLHGVGRLPRLAPDVVVLGRPAPDGAESAALVALDPTTGDVRWEWETTWSGTVRTDVQPAGATGILVTGDGRLARVDAATGKTVWDVETLDGAYLQAHASGYVSSTQLVGDTAPQLWIHDVETGAVVQRMPATRIATHLVVDGVVVVHAPSEGVVRGMDLATGEPRWQVLLDGTGALGFPVSATDSGPVVLLERETEQVRRLDPADGSATWQARLQRTAAPSGSATFFGQPMLVDDVVVVEDTASVITVLDLATGEERVRVGGDPQLDVRSLDPLTLVEGSRWMRVAVPGPDRTDAAQ